MMDKNQAKRLAAEYADDSCRACAHVLNGAAVAEFVHRSGEYVAVCSPECLDGDLHHMRVGQITQSDPKVVHVLHIPVNVRANLEGDHWKIDLLEDGYQPLGNDFLYSSRVPEDFDDTEFHLWIPRFVKEKTPHYIGYGTGIQFVPVCRTPHWANSILRGFPRLYNRLLSAPMREICEMTRASNRKYDGTHNYVGIIEKDNIECVICDRVIRVE